MTFAARSCPPHWKGGPISRWCNGSPAMRRRSGIDSRDRGQGSPRLSHPLCPMFRLYRFAPRSTDRADGPAPLSRGGRGRRGAVVCKHMGRRVGYVCARKSPLRNLPHGRIRAVPSAAGDSAGVDFHPARGRAADRPAPYPVLMGHGYMGARPKCLIRAAEIGLAYREGRIRHSGRGCRMRTASNSRPPGAARVRSSSTTDPGASKCSRSIRRTSWIARRSTALSAGASSP